MNRNNWLFLGLKPVSSGLKFILSPSNLPTSDFRTWLPWCNLPGHTYTQLTLFLQITPTITGFDSFWNIHFTDINNVYIVICVTINTICTSTFHHAQMKFYSCGSLKEKNLSYSLEHLGTWYPVGNTIWWGLGGADLLQEVGHCGRALRLQVWWHSCFPFCVLYLWLKYKHSAFCSCSHNCCHASPS